MDQSQMIEQDVVFFIPAVNYEFCARLSDNSSVFDAELMAILKAVQWVESNPPFQCVILSDCLSAVQSICSDDKNSSVIEEFVQQRWIFKKENGINSENNVMGL